MGEPFRETFGATTTWEVVAWDELAPPDKTIADAVPPQFPAETVLDVNVNSSKFGPPLMFAAVGTRLIRLFPATKGTAAVIVAQVSQLAVTPKITETGVEAAGEIRVRSIGRAVAVPSE